MLLIPCPWCGPRDETEFRYGGQAHLAYPDDPAALSDEAWADFLFMRDNPTRTVVGAVDACRRLSPLVQRGAGHRHEPRSSGPIGSARRRPGCPTDGVDAGSTKAVTASIAQRPLELTFEGRTLGAFAGDTLASALLANGVDVVCPSPILGRPRGVFSAGVEEPCAFVEVTAPSFEPIMPAPMVKLLDHLDAAAGPVSACSPTATMASRPRDHRHVHVETLVVGGGAAGLREARAAVAAGDRTMLVDERHWLGGTASSDDTVDGIPALAWIDDVVARTPHLPGHRGPDRGHRARRLRRRLRGGVRTFRPGGHPVARPGRPGRARHRRARTPDRVRRLRPSRRDAGFGRGDVRGPLRRGGRRARRGLHHEPRRPRRRDRPGGRRDRDRRRDRRERGRSCQRCDARARRRRPQRLGGDGDRGRPAGVGGARRRSRWRRRDDRGRPAAGLRRMEPGDPAVAWHRGRPAVRRGPRVLRPGWRRPSVALDRRCRGGRGAHERAVLVHAGRRTCPGTTSICSATRPSPTCSRPSATTSTAPST